MAKKPKQDQAQPPISGEGVSLEQIRFIDMHATTHHITGTEVAQSVDMQLSVNRPAIRLHEDTALVSCPFTLRVTDKEVKDGLVCEIRALAEVMYRWPAGPPVEISDAFKSALEVHASFAAWPFWRELVSSALNRMSLPPVTMPLMTQANIREHFAKAPPRPIIRLTEEMLHPRKQSPVEPEQPSLDKSEQPE